jgi:hypothetical protein
MDDNENAKERREDSVRLKNCPTQAKTGLEWATGHPFTLGVVSRFFAAGNNSVRSS